MIKKLLDPGFILFNEYFSCVATEQESLNYLANTLFFVSGLCFGYCFAYKYLSRVTIKHTDAFLFEYSDKQ